MLTPSLPARLCFICCHNFRPEVAAAVAAEGWPDVTVAALPARCGHPPLTWEELAAAVPRNCTQVVLLGRACLQALGPPPAGWPPVRQCIQTECFHLVAGPTLVAEAIGRDGYLVTPGWLRDWRSNLRDLGFADKDAAGFFREFAQELVLLDTGVDADAPEHLAAFASAVGLPATRIALGIDYTRLLLARIVGQWRLDEERRQAQSREHDRSQQLADQMAAMDFLARLPRLKDEDEAIATIEEMFRALFAPQTLHYLPVEGGVPRGAEGLSEEFADALAGLEREWAWTDSGHGFLLRIGPADRPLGYVIAERLAFPQFAPRYLNLALSLAGVCALAIENARTFQHSKQAEESLRKSEYSFRMAQAVAHVGHWEWNADTDDMRWSDETFRILGYQPQTVTPNRHVFLEVIHPDDRAKVAEHIAKAQQTGSFDLEYRILLPDGRIRVVHGTGGTMRPGAAYQARLVGTIEDVTAQRPGELLGVIQDITSRKELEQRLAKEARTDVLTGCANRRHFMELAAQEVARVRRYGGELSLLMLDIDRFKSINDAHGHQAGDLALQKLVEVCRQTLREEDRIGRLGGEEFAILLPETGLARAAEVAERLRGALAEVDLRTAGSSGPSLRFTASIGVSALTAADEGVESVLARADQALYQAKNRGRDRVEILAGATSQPAAT